METRTLFATVKRNGRTAKVLGFYSLDEMPKVVLFDGQVINLRMFADYIRKRPEDEAVVFGREDWYADFEIGADRTYSRVHFAIIRMGEQCLILDCSLNGTAIAD